MKIKAFFEARRKNSSKVASTTVELHDLGKFNQEWSGILSPAYDDQLIGHYVHDQFLENAERSVSSYKNRLNMDSSQFGALCDQQR